MKSNLRQPGATTNISDNYDDHLDRGSLGGDDLTDSYGTTVHAQLDDAYVSIVDNSPDGSGGRYSRVTGPDGDSVESLHQSSITASRGQRVNADDPIGVSGASAFGSNYGTGGPHIHNHGVRANGVRFNLEPYYWWLNGGTSSAAGGSSTPIDTDEQEIEMSTAQILDAIEKSRVDAVGRQDNVIIPALRALAAAAVNDDAQVERILNAVRREARPRQYRRTKTGEIAAIDTDEGFYHSFASLAERENWMRLQMVAPENAVECTEADWALLMAQVQGKLHTHVDASSDPIDLGTLVPAPTPIVAPSASAAGA